MSESANREVPQKDWIETLLESLGMVQWDRFVRAEDDGLGVFFDIYGWIDREEDAYKDFILLRVFPETDENLRMFTTSSDRYHDEINETLFGDTSESNHCQRVEHTFEVPNVVEIDESELATDGGVDQDDGEIDLLGLDNELWRYKLGAVEVILHEWAEGRGVYKTAGTADTPLEAAQHEGPAIKDGHYRVYRQRDDGIVAGHHPHVGRRESYSPNDEFDQEVTLLAGLENVE